MATFIKLTRPANVIHLNADLATMICEGTDRDKDNGLQGQINILGSQGGDTYVVRETPEQILALIQAAKES